MNSTKKLTAQLAVTCYTHNPADATTAAVPAYVPMANFAHFLAAVMLISGTGLLTVKIYAATSAAGADATEVKAHADPTVADAAGDTVFIEASAEDIRGALATATHVGVQVDCDHADDIVALTYVRDGGRWEYEALTADIIA